MRRLRAMRPLLANTRAHTPTAIILTAASSRHHAARRRYHSLPSEVRSIEDVLVDGHIHWYPGHMHKTMQALDARVKHCNVIIDVRDARLPFTSANPHLAAVIGAKRRITVYNKSDLATSASQSIVEAYHRDVGDSDSVLFTNAKSPINSKRLLPMIEAHCHRRFSTVPLLVLVMGFPNVGKSQIISQLRNFSLHKCGPKTASVPGYTRHIDGFLIQDQPPIYVYDSPGIMVPSFELTVEGQERALKLALVNAFKDSVIGNETLVRYLLLALNRKFRISYPDYSVLTGLRKTSNIDSVLSHVSYRLAGDADASLLSSDSRQRRDRASTHLLQKFRSGDFGRFQLDDLYLNIELKRTELEELRQRERLRKDRQQLEKNLEHGRKIRIVTHASAATAASEAL